MSEHVLVVELWYSGAWHDLTAAGEVYRDIIVSTKRFGATQTAKINPGSTRMSLVNADGKYNPENPLSPLYGLVGRNTPIRVSADGQVRWTGEAAEWQPARVLGGPRRTEVTGGGILRRLGIGTSPIMSALTSGILAINPSIYLPLTDGPLATVAGTPVPLGKAVAADGVRFGQVAGPPGDTRALPEMVSDGVGGAGAWTATLPTPTGDDWTIDIAMRGVRKPGVANTFDLLNWTTADDTPNEVFWQVGVTWGTSDTTDTIRVFGYEVIGFNSIVVDLTSKIVLDSTWHQIRVQGVHTGTTTEIYIVVDDDPTFGYGSTTLLGGGISWVQLVSATSGVLTSGSVGHIAVYDSQNPGDAWSGFGGRAGEQAADRFARVCAENSINATFIGNAAADSRPMGPQPTARLLDVLYDCVVTDGGILYESATAAELVLRCLGTLYRQTPVLVIDVATDIVPPLAGVVGDRTIRNDVTAQRRGGSSARSSLTTGAMSTQAPPAGVGVYDTQLEVNPSSDASLPDYASWLVACGTTEGVQYPSVTLDLDANPVLDLSDVEIGTVIEPTGIPIVDDPQTPRLLIVGMEERVDTHRRTITLTTVPAIPYDVEILDTGGYLDCGASTTSEALDTTETGVDLLIADVCTWTHADGDYNIIIGGEVMTVTAVGAVGGSLGAYTQTLTVTRSVNGIVKAHASGAEVHVADPVVLAA